MVGFTANVDGLELEETRNTSGGGQSYVDNSDWDGYNKYMSEKLPLGKHQVIGVVSQVVSVGSQHRPEQVLPWDAKTQADHGWRFEKYEDSGLQKDQTARLEQRKRGGSFQECLVYEQKDVKQAAVVVDLLEYMLDTDAFFEGDDKGEYPFRTVIGLYGYHHLRKDTSGKYHRCINRPFNLQHTNVNRQKKGADPLYAIAKNSQLHDLAEYCGVLDGNENFFVKDMSKLVGKVCMFTLEVAEEPYTTKNGEERTNRQYILTPSSTLSPRDESYFSNELASKYDTGLMAFVTFDGVSSNDVDKTLKTIRPEILTTMAFSPEWDGSKIKQEFKRVGKTVLDYSDLVSSEPAEGSGNTGNTSKPEGKPIKQEAPKAKVEPKVDPTPDTDEFEFDDRG